MRSLLVDIALNEGRLEDFAMIDRPGMCRRCNYRRLCFPRPAEPAAAEAPVALELAAAPPA
jgi:DNA-directed RNA polymerase subunit RPC12/RpoP